MERSKVPKPAKARVARHRSRTMAKGSKRVEVTVPGHDASLLKAIARVLRQGGDEAKLIRAAVQPLVSSTKAKTGAELVDFLRQSPLAGVELSLQRDASTGRMIDFG